MDCISKHNFILWLTCEIHNTMKRKKYIETGKAKANTVLPQKGSRVKRLEEWALKTLVKMLESYGKNTGPFGFVD